MLSDLETRDPFKHLAPKLSKIRTEIGPLYADAMIQFQDLFLVHGDLWANNILYDSKSDCKIVDWQCLTTGNLFIDFGNMAFLSMDWKDTKANLDDFAAGYYKKLVEVCSKFGTQDQLPWKDYDGFYNDLMTKGSLVTYLWCITAYQQTEKNPNLKEREFNLLEIVIKNNPKIFG